MNKWLLRYISYKYNYYKIWADPQHRLKSIEDKLLHHIEYTSYDYGYYECYSRDY